MGKVVITDWESNEEIPREKRVKGGWCCPTHKFNIKKLTLRNHTSKKKLSIKNWDTYIKGVVTKAKLKIWNDRIIEIVNQREDIEYNKK